MTGAKFAAMILRAACLGTCVSLLSGAALAVGSDETTKTGAGTCLSGPKGAAPQGERWRYRVERGTKRHCWYTRRESKPAIATQQPRPSAQLKTVASQEPLQLSVANARAEADLSAPSPVVAEKVEDTLPTGSTQIGVRTLNERWSDTFSSGQPMQLLPSNPSTPRPSPPAEPVPATGDDSSDIWIGVVLALIGIATALTVLVSGRRREGQPARWQSKGWDSDDPGSSSADGEATATTLRDPRMDWRKMGRETAQQRNARIERLMAQRLRRTS